ncbi:MAG: RdgB/HAM1 family non-canonical purine NTP pyrophosphatase [Bacteroidota bacterium]
MAKRRLLFGTRNKNKLEEIRQIVDSSFDIASLADIGLDMDVEETEPTIAGNAILKVKAYYEASGIPTFADDTGLEVDALDGAPGVYSARYAGPEATYTANVEKLLAALEGEQKRTARFRTVIAYYDGKDLHTFEGIVEGVITDEPRGVGGFGYDPVFLPEAYEETFAEMPSEDKHAISHRGRAIRKFAHYLIQLP